jgi:hypothetical protein
MGLISAQGSDTREWRVLEGGSETNGFRVAGYNPYEPDPLLSKSVYGPYATLEDAEAVAAARDFVRPLSERLLEREREEADEWFRSRESKKEPEEE